MSEETKGHGTVRRAFDAGFFCVENEVWDLPLPGTELLVYMALTRYAGSNNRAWPSNQRLAHDAKCSERRVQQATKRLSDCKLVVKVARGNRTNNYEVYPPGYYVGKVNDNKIIDIKQGAESAPQSNDTARLYHKGANSAPSQGAESAGQGAESAPSGCKSCALRVQNLHPNNNSNNNKNNNNEQSSSAQVLELTKIEDVKSNSTLNTEEEGVNSLINKKEINPEDIEAVQRAFKSKKAEIRQSEIERMLTDYPVRDICAAVLSCDFNTARNPIAVIKANLRTGNYVMPAAPEVNPYLVEQRKREEEEIDPEATKASIKIIKEKLMKSRTVING